MKVIDFKDLEYKDLQNDLIKYVYIERLELGQELLNIRSSSKYVSELRFVVPDFDYDVGDYFVAKFENEEEMNNAVLGLLNNREYNDCNCIKLCNANTNLTEEEFNNLKEIEDNGTVFEYDDYYLEHYENFKEEIFKKYFKRDLDDILENLRDSLKINYLDELDNYKEAFEDVKSQLSNVTLYNDRKEYQVDRIDFSEYIKNNDCIKEIEKTFNFQKIREMNVDEFSSLNEVSAETGDFEGTDIFYTSKEDNIQVFIHLYEEDNRTIEEICEDKELMQELKDLTIEAYKEELDLKIEELELDEEMEM